jgi:hypothetical protein
LACQLHRIGFTFCASLIAENHFQLHAETQVGVEFTPLLSFGEMRSAQCRNLKSMGA